MTDLKTKINEIKQYIVDIDILTNFGGLCYLKTEGNVTYGISTEHDQKGNLFGNNHNELSGFMNISSVGSKIINNQISQSVAKVDVHVFVPHKLIGENQKYYYVINSLFSLIQKRFWQKYNISYTNSNNKYLDVEYGIIQIEIPYFAGCDELVINGKIC